MEDRHRMVRRLCTGGQAVWYDIDKDIRKKKSGIRKISCSTRLANCEFTSSVLHYRSHNAGLSSA